MLKGENIIIISCADWSNATSPRHIAIELAKVNNVLFIETFGSRLPSLQPEHIVRIGKRITGWFKGLRRLDFKESRLYLYSPIMVMVSLKPLLFVNRFIFLRILRRLIKKLEMKNPILILYLPPPIGAIEKLQKKTVIYYSMDEWSTFPVGDNRIFLESEKKVIEEADIVLAANELLYQKHKCYATRIVKLYHGVDYDHFARGFIKEVPYPSDIKQIPHPIIGIVGTFANWMDLDLIKSIAERHKEWSIVSIGLVESDVDIKPLEDIVNIYFLGDKDYSHLPDYYRAIDVFIIPFLLTEHIRYCAPTRLYEHLSSGKPIVTTDFPAAREIGGGLITIASDKEDFISKIEAALEEKEPSLIARRKALARQNSWRSRIEEISGLIEEILKK